MIATEQFFTFKLVSGGVASSTGTNSIMVAVAMLDVVSLHVVGSSKAVARSSRSPQMEFYEEKKS